MDIQSALKETGKANYDEEDAYAMRDGDNLYWYKEAGELMGQICPVTFNDHFRDDWFPYNPEPQIVPSEAGEFWECGFISDSKGKPQQSYIYSEGGFMRVAHKYGPPERFDEWLDEGREIIHGNGWTRLYPPVQDDVDEIVIEDVRSWEIIQAEFPDKVEGNARNIWRVNLPDDVLKILKDKPPMTMTLRVPKEG